MGEITRLTTAFLEEGLLDKRTHAQENRAWAIEESIVDKVPLLESFVVPQIFKLVQGLLKPLFCGNLLIDSVAQLQVDLVLIL